MPVTAEVETAQTPLRAPGRVGPPPGFVFYVATAIAIVMGIDASSRDSFSTFLLAAPIWLILAGIWAIRFAAATAQSRLDLPIAHWVRWLIVPVVMGFVFFVTRTDALFDARLALSRGAMDQMAAEVMSGGSMERGWVGLYNVGDVERLDNGLRFVVDEGLLSRFGFAFAPEGEPAQRSDDDPLWTEAWHESLGGGWWLWTESWD
jgi:hypothetical protein